jgi:hypothetical protein
LVLQSTNIANIASNSEKSKCDLLPLPLPLQSQIAMPLHLLLRPPPIPTPLKVKPSPPQPPPLPLQLLPRSLSLSPALRRTPSNTRSPLLLARASAGPALPQGQGDGDAKGKGASLTPTPRDALVRIGELLSLAFPLWVGAACALALCRPPSFLWVGRPAQIVGLTLTMLGTPTILFLPFLLPFHLLPSNPLYSLPLQNFHITLPAHHACYDCFQEWA